MWMRFSQVLRASGCQCQSRNCPGFIPASSDTVESEGRQMKQCWITYIYRCYFVSLRFFRFILLISVPFRFRFFLGQTIFRFIFVSLRFFRLVSIISRSSMWNKWNHAFFSLPSERKFSLQFQFSLPKRKWGRTLVGRIIGGRKNCRSNREKGDALRVAVV
jgi:hypothetical protein